MGNDAFTGRDKGGYHGNHNGRRPEKENSYAGSAQRNMGPARRFGGEASKAFTEEKDPKKRYGAPRVGAVRPVPRAVRVDGEIPSPDSERVVSRPTQYRAPVPEMPENLLVGRNPIREALKNGRSMEKLLYAKGDLSGAARELVNMAREAGVVTQEVDRSRLDAIYQGHQGLLAYVSSASYSTVDEILALAEERGEDPFIILLDGVTDPHNLGAIIRIAECAGAHGVIIPDRRSAGLNPACVKAAAGAVEYVRVARVTNLARTVDELKERGIWIYAADMRGENVDDAPLSGAIGIVIGSEGEGVSHLVLSKCDGRVSIPMKGHIDSLNASVAAGVILYAVVRKRADKA